MDITSEEYVAKRGALCPHCGGKDVGWADDPRGVSADTGGYGVSAAPGGYEVTILTECWGCDATWKEVYHLAGCKDLWSPVEA